MEPTVAALPPAAIAPASGSSSTASTTKLLLRTTYVTIVVTLLLIACTLATTHATPKQVLLELDAQRSSRPPPAAAPAPPRESLCKRAIARGEGRWVETQGTASPPRGLGNGSSVYKGECAPLARLLFGSTLRLCEKDTALPVDSSSREEAALRLARQRQRVRRANEFSWLPSPSCTTPPRVQPLAFAGSLAASWAHGARRLLLIGDSLSKQHAISLLCLLLPAVDVAATHTLRTTGDPERAVASAVASALAPHHAQPTATPTAASGGQGTAPSLRTAPSTSGKASANKASATTKADFAHAFVLVGGGMVQYVFNDRLLEIAGITPAATPASTPASTPAAAEGGRVGGAAAGTDAAGGGARADSGASGGGGTRGGGGVRAVRYVERPATKDSTISGRRVESWARRVRLGAVGARDVLVFNSGAHWPRAQGRAYASMVQGVLGFLLDRPSGKGGSGAGAARFEGSIVYRTNWLPGCSAERAPSAADARLAAAARRFNWGELGRYDQMWADAMHARRALLPHAEPRPRLRVLNVSNLTGLRGDGHCEDCASTGAGAELDCLHYCLPGPVDTWSALLQKGHLLSDETG